MYSQVSKSRVNIIDKLSEEEVKELCSYTDLEVIQFSEPLKETALLEYLYSTGWRAGEVGKLNIEYLNCSAIVYGKGSRQREIYFTTECKVGRKRGAFIGFL
ncbi:tyrosine-type recombinase/integrase [Paenibacillus sp. UNC451MF]|uniref:tyrosine-type recombinase/integrase n=1 Tax=Paenibacillus sp. UNC451MF TaxID=1449063 RepID=UPI00068989CA|nr:tyrosine-type recombinase/integrase [Paenibacillus sp. UNC451MF]